jgi:hypothetical protein
MCCFPRRTVLFIACLLRLLSNKDAFSDMLVGLTTMIFPLRWSSTLHLHASLKNWPKAATTFFFAFNLEPRFRCDLLYYTHHDRLSGAAYILAFQDSQKLAGIQEGGSRRCSRPRRRNFGWAMRPVKL